ncbi:MAG: Crp/Fnr family transcriptional regulator [Flavobacteriales bacterium]|nr:Crp/Fnr family transcriptional regulator [Flavobacteriales bacterium]
MIFEEYLKNVYEFDTPPFPYTRKKLRAGHIITDYQEIEQKMYFLEKGLVEETVLEDDKESIVAFFCENSFVTSFASLLKQIPSDKRITTIEECEITVIQRDDLFNAYERCLKASRLGRIESDKAYLQRVRREKLLITKSAAERYQLILEEESEIIRRVPNYKIAAYLGITPESLSRIRRRIIS